MNTIRCFINFSVHILTIGSVEAHLVDPMVVTEAQGTKLSYLSVCLYWHDSSHGQHHSKKSVRGGEKEWESPDSPLFSYNLVRSPCEDINWCWPAGSRRRWPSGLLTNSVSLRPPNRRHSSQCPVQCLEVWRVFSEIESVHSLSGLNGLQVILNWAILTRIY